MLKFSTSFGVNACTTGAPVFGDKFSWILYREAFWGSQGVKEPRQPETVLAGTALPLSHAIAIVGAEGHAS